MWMIFKTLALKFMPWIGKASSSIASAREYAQNAQDFFFPYAQDTTIFDNCNVCVCEH